MGSTATNIPVAHWKAFLRNKLGAGFISTSQLNDSIDNKKWQCDHKGKSTKILVKIKIYKKNCLAVLQYLYLSDTNTLTKKRNIWTMFEIEKCSLFKTPYDIEPSFLCGPWNSTYKWNWNFVYE